MKTIARTMFLALGIFGLLGAAAAHDPEPLVSVYVSEPLAIDGDLGDWDLSRFTHVTPQSGVFDAESGTAEDSTDLSFSFGVANDDEYLYVAVLIVDDILVLDTNEDPADKEARAWMDDAVEIFIDGDHSHSPDARDAEGVEYKTGGEFSIVANGAVTSTMSGVPKKGGDPRYWTSAGSYGPPPGAAYQAPWDVERKGFAVEARFNFGIMGEGVSPGSRIGFTVSAHDDDDGRGRDVALYWKGRSPSCWKDEGGWGDLVLALPTPSPVKPSTYGEVKNSTGP